MSYIEEKFAYGIVIGGSIFGILWGLINALLVRKVNMEDYQYLRKANSDSEKETLLEGEHSPHDAKECLD